MPPAKRKPASKPQGGRPAHMPNEELRMRVRIMSSLGVPEDDQCRILQISVPTLRKYYAEEMRIGGLEATIRVTSSLYATALKGGREGTSAAIFWLKCRAGWREDGSTGGNGPGQPPAEPKLGKKEKQAEAARNPDQGTTMGQLMALRQRMRPH